MALPSERLSCRLNRCCREIEALSERMSLTGRRVMVRGAVRSESQPRGLTLKDLERIAREMAKGTRYPRVRGQSLKRVPGVVVEAPRIQEAPKPRSKKGRRPKAPRRSKNGATVSRSRREQEEDAARRKRAENAIRVSKDHPRNVRVNLTRVTATTWTCDVCGSAAMSHARSCYVCNPE